MPGGIVHLKRGGHQIRAETIMLNDGIDHVIYLLAPGLAFGIWQLAARWWASADQKFRPWG